MEKILHGAKVTTREKWEFQRGFPTCLRITWIISFMYLITSTFGDLQCSDKDKIDISSGDMNITDRSIVYNNIHYTSSVYEVLNDTLREKSSILACSCTGIKCLRLCCQRGYILSNYDSCIPHSTGDDIHLLVDYGSYTMNINIFEKYSYHVSRSCDGHMILANPQYSDEIWNLTENGDVMMNYSLLPEDKYCIGTNSNESILFYCQSPINEDPKHAILPYVLIVSVPCMIITFIVYAILPELRNVHGKSLMCYLSGLIVAYTLLTLIKLNTAYIHIETLNCYLFGYTAYFAFLSAFFWLNVVSFDLWWNFRGMKGISKFADNKKFLIYSVYAWGCALAMLSICLLFDFTDIIPIDYRPLIGYSNCFLHRNQITEFIYFYAAISLIICSNSMFFLLTALKIRRVQREMARITATEDSRRHQQHLNNEKDKFGLFLRLFIVMGITWILEVTTWAFEITGWFGFLPDLCNATQGLFILILFVLKPKVKQLIIKRWYISRGKPLPSNMAYSSSTTKTSSIPLNNKSLTEKALLHDA